MGSWGPYVHTAELPAEFSSEADPGVLGGFSLMAEGDVDKNGGVEIVMTYMPQLYYRASGGMELVEKVKRMHISMGYRHWFNPKYSIAGSLYSSYSIGDVVIVHSKNAIPGYKTAARNVGEDGMDFSFVHEFYARADQKLFAFVEARYSYSFSTRGGEVRDGYGAMLGIKHFIQENSRSESAP